MLPRCDASPFSRLGYSGTRPANFGRSLSTLKSCKSQLRSAQAKRIRPCIRYFNETYRVVRVQSYYQQTDDERGADSGSAEPRGYNSPPPPPPPPPPRRAKSRRRFPLWTVILALLIAAGLWWGYIDSQMPQVYKDGDGMQYMLTKGGNQVMVGEDTDGRVYFVDKAGNFYYDSGDPSIGVYVVTADDEVYNLFDDGSGQRQRVLVGNFRDLRTQRVSELGGIPVDKLRRAAAGFDGTVTGFDIPADAGEEPAGDEFGNRPPPKAIVEYNPDVVMEKEVKD